jgi:hypothetical protein
LEGQTELNIKNLTRKVRNNYYFYILKQVFKIAFILKQRSKSLIERESELADELNLNFKEKAKDKFKTTDLIRFTYYKKVNFSSSFI